ncbi:MAG TPA: glucose 1-dehydrogenase [Actinomycetota bacterium]|jgi:NAD(P)-dependent dehydrogenase (short-subunit alcohol dehydrogenase family)|nr:glucose 1-dehydrogenase [Actinomycetota bacterium]
MGNDVSPFDLSGATALVTGASRGIGRAIALGLAAAGADVAGLARTEPALLELGEQIETLGRGFLAVPADVSDPGATQTAVDRIWAWRGRIDVLVNAAGVIVRRDPPGVTPDEFDAVFGTNVRGTFFLTQAVGARMLEAGGGSIVNVASLAGEVVTGAAVTYQASKAAVIQMTRALAVRWAPGVRVNAVGPGYIRTSLNSAWLEDPENLRYVTERTPLGRVGTPEDVVGAVVFFASPASAFVTGQHLLVDGGWSAQ